MRRYMDWFCADNGTADPTTPTAFCNAGSAFLSVSTTSVSTFSPVRALRSSSRRSLTTSFFLKTSERTENETTATSMKISSMITIRLGICRSPGSNLYVYYLPYHEEADYLQYEGHHDHVYAHLVLDEQ